MTVANSTKTEKRFKGKVSMDKVITDKATDEILKEVRNIRHNLDLIEKNPNDFKYIQMVSGWIKEENESVKQYANTMLKWNN